jgi:hypothetical protein
MLNVECSMLNVEWKKQGVGFFSFNIQHSTFNIRRLPQTVHKPDGRVETTRHDCGLRNASDCARGTCADATRGAALEKGGS